MALLLWNTAGGRAVCLALAGGLIFLSIFHWQYSGIPKGLYEVRDDGVITLSHGRNLVEYGFIGVNPSGERVEGTSAPVQMFVYAAAYAVSGVDYAAFANAQTVVCTFLLGAVFILFFRDRPLWAVAITALSALALTYHTSFFLWHASGMENAVTHTLFAAAVLILFWFARTGRIQYELSVVVFLAAISRLDSIVHIAPVLAVFSVFWLLAFRDRKGIYFSCLVMALWAAFNLWRYLYFGDLSSNTAHAQDIALFSNLSRLSWAHRVLTAHGALLLLAASPLLAAVLFRRVKSWPRRMFPLILGSFVFTAALTPLVFGPARLDPARTTTYLALIVVLSAALAVHYGLGPAVRTLFSRDRQWLGGVSGGRLLAWTAATVLTAVVVIAMFEHREPYFLCCEVTWMESERRQDAEWSDRESLPRPTVSNPDLGARSWHKDFNVVDLGRLGSPVLAKAGSPARRTGSFTEDYLFDFIAPDVIRLHSYWSCLFADTLMADARFKAAYLPLKTRVTDWTQSSCRDHPESLSGVWVWKDVLKDSNSLERKLIDDLQANLTPSRLRQELGACQADPENLCTYVARTAYRFLPEFREQGAIKELNSIFSDSRTRDFDLYLINGYRDGQAHVKAMESIRLYHTE